jgi:hypothetical protein
MHNEPWLQLLRLQTGKSSCTNRSDEAVEGLVEFMV